MARRENDQLLSLQSELLTARRQITQLQQLLEEDSDRHPSNKKAEAAQAALTRARNELAESRAVHAIASRELEKAKDTNDQHVVQYLAHVKAIQDWKNTCGVLKKQLTRNMGLRSVEGGRGPLASSPITMKMMSGGRTLQRRVRRLYLLSR